jgi:phosphoglycolate phosphatase-like HAD superfamily hydrolase
LTIKAVIFDKDGVFIESFNTVYAAMNQALTHFGYLELSRLELRKEWWGIRADLSLEKNLGIRSDEAVEIF